MNPGWRAGCIAALVVLTVAVFILAWTYPSFPGDEAALLGLQRFQSPWITTLALAASFIGGTLMVLVVVGVTALGLLLQRRWVDALILGLGLVLMGVGNVLKLLVGRSRPEHLLAGAPPDSLSFPSGHALSSVILGGLLMVLVEELIPSRLIRRALQAGILFLVLAIGASRVYLGVHWPSDVVGGYLFGIVMLWGLTWLRQRLLTR